MGSETGPKRAREYHRESMAAERAAIRHRRQRNRLVRRLRAADPDRWTYPALAEAIGCSPELIAAIVKGRTRD